MQLKAARAARMESRGFWPEETSASTRRQCCHPRRELPKGLFDFFEASEGPSLSGQCPGATKQALGLVRRHCRRQAELNSLGHANWL